MYILFIILHFNIYRLDVSELDVSSFDMSISHFDIVVNRFFKNVGDFFVLTEN